MMNGFNSPAMTTVPVNKFIDGIFLLYKKGALISIMEHFGIESKRKLILSIFDIYVSRYNSTIVI
jgi:hypothetical protein